MLEEQGLRDEKCLVIFNFIFLLWESENADAKCNRCRSTLAFMDRNFGSQVMGWCTEIIC